MRYVMLGAPGSGKGTQAELLSAALGVPAISTGEMLRHAVSTGSELGRKVEKILVSGALVDDDTIADVVEERLVEPDAGPGFLLDGYPRTLAQARALDKILCNRDETLDAVIYIKVPEEELVRRALDRQREDDTQDVIERRLAVYREQTEPLVSVYKERGVLQEIDGHQSIEQVSAAILDVLQTTAADATSEEE